MKGLRWLLLKFQGDLNESKNERKRLMDALGLHQSLAIAYYLKEDLAQMWQQPRQGCCQHLSERLVWPCPGVRNKGPASNGTVVLLRARNVTYWRTVDFCKLPFVRVGID